jgi:hypothetical protein
VGRRRSDVRWIASEVFTSDDFGRSDQEACHRRRASVLGVHRCSSEAREGPADVFSIECVQVEFGIEFVLGTNPISKAPYRMVLFELK